MSGAGFDPYSRGCVSRGLLDDIADRWSVLVLGVLAAGPARYTTLATRVDGVSQKMLTKTLRTLERDGLLVRDVFAEVPPRVEYQLTPLGRTLAAQLSGLDAWVRANMMEVLAARAGYDGGPDRAA